jgi:hypothetical protein
LENFVKTHYKFLKIGGNIEKGVRNFGEEG